MKSKKLISDILVIIGGLGVSGTLIVASGITGQTYIGVAGCIIAAIIGVYLLWKSYLLR